MSAKEPANGKKRARLDSEEDEAEVEHRRERFRDLMEQLAEDPLPEPTDDDKINYAKSLLREHIGNGKESPGRDFVLFFVERAPPSSQRGAACSFPTCNEKIKEGDYRIAVDPGMRSFYRNADLYHVRCFEKLVDFSQSNYLGRINPVTRNTVRLRGVKGTSVLDGNYLVDGGAERLILEWKVSMGRLIDKRDGVPIEPLEPEFNDLLRKSGSASYQPRKVKGMTDIEFINLAHNLAPIESDGDGDQEEWNLFEQYLPLTFDDSEDLNEPHSLSSMLCAWKSHRTLVLADEDRLTEKGKEKRNNLGDKAIRAIKRLAAIPMPNFQSAFLGSFT